MDPTIDAAEHAARTSYGRLLALLTRAGGDIVSAEDALADAFERALRTWPSNGVPRNPDGWLLTAARNRQRDHWKSGATRTSVPLDPDADIRVHLDEIDADGIADRRLQLMLLCAHPDVEPGIRTALMLDVVLGYTAQEIGRAFNVPGTTMGARLGRAKKRIGQMHIPFELPDATTLEPRIDAVSTAVYGAFAIAWNSVGLEIREGFASESLYLAETLSTLLPDDAEAHGLTALIALSTARLPALRVGGSFVPLGEQDVSLWNVDLLERGELHLRRAHELGSLGRFQLEAAVQAVHCARRRSGTTDWATLFELHTLLQSIDATVGGGVALAVVTAELHGPERGLQVLDALSDTARFQPAWAARAHLLHEMNDVVAARAAYEKAIDLCPHAATRKYLRSRADLLHG